MLTRCSARYSTRVTTRLSCKFHRRSPITRVSNRRYASDAANAPNNNGASTMGPLAGLTNELDRIAPRFEVDARDVDILEGPVEFYETLKTKILNAKYRIYLATLYIGKSEHELISTLRTALNANPNLKVSFLTDMLRGTRESPDPCCASLLMPLVAEFGSERVQVRMFHTPNLVGTRKRMIPKRINEGWGLQHMKLYGIDDEIIMSGANLSNDYFTNRQDRYHVFRSKALTDYYFSIHTAVSNMSFDMRPSTTPAGYGIYWPEETNKGPDPLSHPQSYIFHADAQLRPLIKPSSIPAPPASSTNTLIYPLFQFTPLLPSPKKQDPTTSTEFNALSLLLSHLAKPPFAPATWTFTAGYFNMTPAIRDLLLSSNPSSATVIAASPWANGFYGSKGVSGMLPAAYTYLSKKFLESVHQASLDDRVKLLEWRRGTVGEPHGWTYHAKGLWVTLPQASPPPPPSPSSSSSPSLAEKPSTIASTITSALRSTITSTPPQTPTPANPPSGPSITLVGSSNYTARSYTLDLEANALIVTRDPALQARLKAEEQNLRKHATQVGPDEFAKPERKVSWVVRVSMWIVGVVGGAL